MNILLHQLRAKRLVIIAIIYILAVIGFLKLKNIRKARWYLRKAKQRSKSTNRRKQKPREDPWAPLDTEIDIFDRTGLFRGQFEAIFEQVAPLIQMPRNLRPGTPTKTRLSLRKRLLVVLHWLREYPKYKLLRDLYGISPGLIARDIRHILPKLFTTIRTIAWPETPHTHPFESVVGAVDCTSHFRFRVHPRSGDWYRSDKGGFFITAQVVTSLTGVIYNIQLGLGHNNDGGMFNLTGLNLFLERRGLKLLADGGYSHVNLVTPNEDNIHWNHAHKTLRSVVETVIGLCKNYSVAGGVCRHDPETHQLAIIICYQLTNIQLIRFPLRIAVGME